MSKITLATLATATAQQVFEQVRDHMLRQMKRSMLFPTGPLCAYRSHDGLACAAGCLIGDDEYTPALEKAEWRLLVGRGAVPGHHMELVRSLQGIHDGYMPENWERELRILAREERLQWTITLATLPTASAQEVLEQAAKHLLKQNAVCVAEGGCAYRGEAGACAAGALMSDADAESLTLFNVGHGWSDLVDRRLVPRDHQDLVVELQRIHDVSGPADWRRSLRRLAQSHGLDSSFMDLLPVPYSPVSIRETGAA